MPALTGERPIRASGTVTLTMIVNLKRFVRRGAAPGDESALERFEQVRGTERFAAYLRVLPERMRPPFVRDTEEDALIDAAHQMRIFRGYVVSQYFFPTYRLDEDAFLRLPDRLEGDTVLIETFPQWDYQVTLTRNGFAVVRMIRQFTDTPLSVIAAEIQRVERARGGELEYAESRSSWRIAMDVTAALVQAMGGCMTLTGEHGEPIHLPLDPEQRRGRLPLHDRYTTIQLDHVHRGGETIPPEVFATEYSSFALGMTRLATVLHGGAAQDMRQRRAVTPADLFNLSPWVGDLCLVTNDSLLIYSPPPTDPAADPDGYTRPQFWRGVARGVEWLVNLKTEWQLIERQSTELLSTISNLTTRVNDGLLDDEDKRRLRALAQGVSRAFNILPEVRYALVPSTISHAPDAVLIYGHVLEQLGVNHVAEHVDTNMAELSSFLTYYSSTQLQFESRQQEEAENRTGLTISIMLILLSLVSVPSLVKDASEIHWEALAALPPLQQVALVGLAALPILLLVITALYVVRRLRRR